MCVKLLSRVLEGVSHIDNSISIHYSFIMSACRGVVAQLLPEDVQRFSGCVVINGDLVFNFITYDEFT